MQSFLKIFMLTTIILMTGCTKPNNSQTTKNNSNHTKTIIICSGKYSDQASGGLKIKLDKINKEAELALKYGTNIETGFELRDFVGEDAHIYELYLGCINNQQNENN